MERQIGEVFEHNGEWYQCVEGVVCLDCSFSQDGCTCDINGKLNCTRNGRNDNKSVVFKKLEKVGEPYPHYCSSRRIIYFQRYKLLDKSYSHNTEYIVCDFNEEGIVSIEIKPNKETMEDVEEKKLNLKPFDLEKAKAGKPVCTRDGRKARIICFDAKGTFSIIALIDEKVEEFVLSYTADGKYSGEIAICNKDLMMLPEKKEG